MSEVIVIRCDGEGCEAIYPKIYPVPIPGHSCTRDKDLTNDEWEPRNLPVNYTLLHLCPACVAASRAYSSAKGYAQRPARFKITNESLEEACPQHGVGEESISAPDEAPKAPRPVKFRSRAEQSEWSKYARAYPGGVPVVSHYLDAAVYADRLLYEQRIRQ